MSSTALHSLREPSVFLAKSPDNGPGLAAATVLITDEHYKHSLGMVRHLGRMGTHVSVVASAENSLVCRSRYCQEAVLSTGPTVEAYVEATLRAVRRVHYDLVIPVSYAMTLALAQQRAQILRYTHLELVESNTIELAGNKVKMTELAGNLGVPAPRTVAPASPDEINNGLRELTFPVVIKPRKESPGHPPVRYARNRGELQDLLAGESFSESEAPLLQEFIPGRGCGFFATYQKGVCKRVFMHRRVREYPATGGVSSCAESFYDPKLEAYGRRMLDALGWHGVAMVEFRQDSRDGDYKLMEINPKFWGSLDLALAAGADFPDDLCQMALGKSLPFVADYRRNLRFHWPLSSSGDLFHLWTRPTSLFNVVSDFLDPRVRSNVWISDPGPNFEEVRGLVSRLLRRRNG